MDHNSYTISYPRRKLIRTGMTALGRLLLNLLANVEINGQERLPQKGPVILAGNHAAVLEVVMMAVYTPGMVEFFGTGDIPLDPRYAFIVNAYDLIPVNRGNFDRKGLQMAVEVLSQGAILGLFPEGGIWDPTKMHAQTGIAWLSYRAKAPVVPIGFGGIRDGLERALKFKSPRLVMNVGTPLPPVSLKDNENSIKSNLQDSANKILQEINALIPECELTHYQKRLNDIYHLTIRIHAYGEEIPLPEQYEVKHGAAYARLLYNATIMDVLVRNLHLPVKPLKRINREPNLEPILNAWKAILSYLNINPGFFTYRFGMEEGLAVKDALEGLIHLGEWLQESGYCLTLVPIHKFRNAYTGALVIERGGCFPKSM